MNHFIELKDFTAKQINAMVKLSYDMKINHLKYTKVLKGKTVGILFQKPSLRTKTAFCVGAMQLGANVIYYSPDEVRLGKRERICDASRTMSRYLDGVVMRTFHHSDIVEFAKYSSVPVVNGLSDILHPSQVLADVLTINEYKKNIKKIKVAYIGDGNNVCHSLMYALAILGGDLHIASPKGYMPSTKVFKDIASNSQMKGNITIVNNPKQAAKDADVLYTDVWVSMGDEAQRSKRKKAFGGFQVNDNLLKTAKKNCIVMHCLPAHRGEEITDSVLDGKQSVVFTQAENRLYAAKAIFASLILRGQTRHK
ncbi:MAG: ornithine carbamoyltransferase [Candidatus Omnitrophica bacterium]|nr:ornithine carbamoyltransferase [Candidatus Omnitrophota bacterium]